MLSSNGTADLKRDAQLQAACDHVDSVERQISRLMFALKDMGYEWKSGRPYHTSEYDFRYALWSNGPRNEGDLTPNMGATTNELIDDAIAMFRENYAKGERFIVWRLSPEFNFKNPFAPEDKQPKKLYFRWHFLSHVPSDYTDAR